MATKWLEEHKWNLESAIDAYLSRQVSQEKKKPSSYDPKLVEIFDKYSEEGDSNRIDVDGTILYLEDLGFDPEDPISLTLAFFLKAPSMGVFERAAFLDHWQEAKCNTLPKMKKYITAFHEEVYQKDNLFQELYNFTFGFLMEVPGQRLLSYETAADYWKLLLLQNASFSNCTERLNQWLEFVTDTYKKNFSRDSWQMFYIFARTVIATDPKTMKDYDEMSAWPSVIDEYIEYLKDNKLME